MCKYYVQKTHELLGGSPPARIHAHRAEASSLPSPLCLLSHGHRCAQQVFVKLGKRWHTSPPPVSSGSPLATSLRTHLAGPCAAYHLPGVFSQKQVRTEAPAPGPDTGQETRLPLIARVAFGHALPCSPPAFPHLHKDGVAPGRGL